MAPRTQRNAAAEDLQGAGGGGFEGFLGGLLGVALLFLRGGGPEEAFSIKRVRVGTPDSGGEVQDFRGHLNGGVLFKEVVIVEQSVLEDFAGGADVGL